MLEAAQNAAFFKRPAQMDVPYETSIQLQSEGIDSPECIVGFDEDSISRISDSLRTPRGRVLDLTPGDVAGDAIPTPISTF